MKQVKIIIGSFIVGIFGIGALFGLKNEWFKSKKSQSNSTEIAIDMQQGVNTKNVMPLVIIGSGPAALNAAMYGARARIDTLIIQGNKPGGALTETSYIENWPGRAKILGSQLMLELTQQAQSFGVNFLRDTVDSVDFSVWPFELHTQGNKTIRALSVIISTGSTPKSLGIVGEREYWGKGVTTCAICDAPFHKDHDVVVVGGGDSAVEEAMQLAPYAKTVTILVRKDHLRAAESMQERLHEYANIFTVYNVEVQKIEGDGSHVTSVQLLDNKIGKISTKQVQGVFLAIGHDPNTELFKKDLETDAQGYLKITGRTQQTSKKGVFAAGDVEDNRYRQAGVAAGNGIKAALDAIAFLQEHGFSTSLATVLAKNRFIDTQERAIEVAHLDDKNDFESVLKTSKGPVVLDFYAEYCPSCMRMLPDLEEVAYHYSGQAHFYKVDLEKSKELAKTLHVQSIPTVLVYNDGQLVGRYNQAMNKKELDDFVMKFVQV